ncbi:MAG TPA: YiiX/YebB-like N1pC/P60 family cysteine hydrolase [Pantanalinema sp.]
MFKIETALGSLRSLFSRRVQPKTEQPTELEPPRATSRDALALTPAVPAAPKAPPSTDGLGAEEIRLLGAGLLPHNYAELKACLEKDGREAATALGRKGKEGPFSPRYGDPVAMLEAARRIASDPELSRMVEDVRKGDILVQTWNSENMVSEMTKGPFVHTVICVSDEAPPEFVEAMGITGDPDAPGSSVVRRSPIAENSYQAVSTRIIRPTEGIPEAEAARAIDRAVRYAESQLGKPYDYSFTNRNGDQKLTDAFYCSELTYLAYASPSGANISFPVSKSSDRDQLMVALESVIDALQPKDRAALMDRTMKFVNKSPKPDAKAMVRYLVDEVMAKCDATAGICKTPGARARLKETLGKLLAGEGFSRFEGAGAAYRKAEADGAFEGVTGFFKRQQARGAIGTGFVMDAAALVSHSGVNYLEAARTAKDLLAAVLPHAETFASYLYGPKDGRTQAVGKLLDGLEWIQDETGSLPLLGELIDDLPERSRPAIKSDFVSPTDIAYAPFTHRDYNVKPGHPLDPPADGAA